MMLTEMPKIQYHQVAELTDKEKFDILMDVTKEELAMMIVENDKYVNLLGGLNYFTVQKINRVEVITAIGRAYVNWDEKNNIQLDLQDDGRTLKVFINKKIMKGNKADNNMIGPL